MEESPTLMCLLETTNTYLILQVPEMMSELGQTKRLHNKLKMKIWRMGSLQRTF